MNNTQLFFALLGTIATVFGAQTLLVKMYVDAKIEPLTKNVDMLVQYMILHDGKIKVLEATQKGDK